MALTAVQVVNEALALVAQNRQIASLDDGSPAANAANVLYAPTVQLLLRTLDPDFARVTVGLESVSNAPITPWAFEYGYPDDCLRVRQVRPAAGAYDKNDPQPVRWNVAYDPNATDDTKKVILTNQQNALAVYTTSDVTEDDWDSAFQEAVVRRLANPLAMAIAGRPDFARELLEEAERMAGQADALDESVVRPA